MMTAGAGSTPSAAEGYYYSRDPMFENEAGNGQWVGQGAEALGVSGIVDKEDFSAVLRGQDPLSKEQLVEIKNGTNVEDRRAGNDFTFSASKSVSVAFAAGVDGIKEAHDTAVLAVAQHLQEHYSHVRNPDGIENTGNIVAAKFDHSTSRALDPQLHSHLFVTNMTQDKEGSWRANEPRAIFQDQKALGEIYRSELANQLLKQGHELVWTDRANLQFELKNVPQAAIEQFSQRREAIEAQVKEWKESGQHKGVSEPKLHEMAALGTRETKQKGITKESVEKIWNDGFEKAGTSALQVKNGVEASRSKDNSSPEKTADQVVADAARFLSDKEAIIDRAALVQTAARISGGQHQVKDLNAAVETQTERVGQDLKGRELYTTKEIREVEKRNTQALGQVQEFQSLTNKDEVEQFIGQWEKKAGFSLSQGQKDTVVNELVGKGGFAIVQGDPGTGKTTASKVVEAFNTEVLQPSGREHYTLNVAFTGKAALEMSEASGKAAYTIDSFLNAYHSGKINITEPGRVHQRDQATINRGDRIANEANTKVADQQQLAAGLHKVWEKEGRPEGSKGRDWTNSQERNGGGGYRVQIGGRYNFSVGKNGLTVSDRWVTNNSLGGKNIQSTTTQRGLKTTRTESKHGDGFLAQNYAKGVVSRSDGSRSEYSERKTSFMGGLLTKTTRTERGKNSVKISNVKSFGRSSSGVTKTINRDGTITETKWTGSRSFFTNKFEITHRSTRTYVDYKQADKHHTSMLDSVIKTVAIGVLKLIDPPTTNGKVYVPERVAEPTKTKTKTKRELTVPRGSQVVVKVDEASFVGARQGEHLLNVVKELREQGVQVKLEMIGDRKQMQSIQAGDLFRQAQGLAKQGKGNYAALKDINRQKDEALLSVAQVLNRDGASGQLSENAKDGLGMLKEQGRITEISDRKELVAATVQRYISEAGKDSKKNEGVKQSVLLVAATNADRHELNSSIREARIASGEIARGEKYKISTPAKIGPTASSYSVGQVVQFTGERDGNGKMVAWGTRLQAKGVVQSMDLGKNKVNIVFETTKKGEVKHITKSFDAAQMVGRTSTHNTEERQFAAGDRVVMLKNDKSLGVMNGQMGTIIGIDEKGHMGIKLDNGDTKIIDTKMYNNIDHGYAVTAEKSQGATVESVIQFAYQKDEKGHGKESFNLLNVAVTRAEHEAHVMTNSIKGLLKSVEKVDEKTSNLSDKIIAMSEQLAGLSEGAEAEKGSEKKAEAPPGLWSTAEKLAPTLHKEDDKPSQKQQTAQIDAGKGR